MTDVRVATEARGKPGLCSAVREKEKVCGFKGYSFLCSQSPADTARYLHLKCLKKLGSTVPPYDAMHLLF